ncbi:hypothetical protein LRP88_04861 [Fusarium phalaenopsidis]|nr:HET domain-containing protein [Fusarium sp. Ph1]
MRLISAKKFTKDGKIRFKEFYRNNIPSYAILSHTWEDGEEVTFEDCKSPVAKDKKGYKKIQNTCRLAIGDGIEYVWIDTCCIDKSSSAELTEAINSMYQWYQQAKVCYAFLSDLQDGNLKDCRWFSRGWTLQELIAPKTVQFFDRSWKNAGDKMSLLKQLSTVTNIDAGILSHKVPLSSACVAKRFSWAAKRKTTRDEDLAYCLLGIFNINMPMLYGEGRKAFTRLQEEIIRTTNDLSIFAWTWRGSWDGRPYLSFLADGPEDFTWCSNLTLRTDPLVNEYEMAITNKGIHIQGPHWVSEYKDGSIRYSLSLQCTNKDEQHRPILIPMRKAGPNIFMRAAKSGRMDVSLGITSSYPINSKSFTLLTRLPREQLTSGSLVSIFRHVAVAVEFPSDVPRLGVHGIPQKCWDVEDSVFFSPDSTVRRWGCVRPSGMSGEMLVCFWHKSNNEWEFQGTILNSAEEGMDGLMQDLFVFAEALDYPAEVVEGVLRRHGVKLGQKSILVWHGGKKFRVYFQVERVNDRRICFGPHFKVKVSRVPLD